MYPLLAALSRRCLPHLATGGIRDGIRSWLEIGSYQFHPGSTAERILLTSIAELELAPYHAFDYQRFALCSVETLSLARPGDQQPKALGWPLVKLYYSAFFAGHALMRALGRGIIRVEASQAKKLTTLGRIFCGEGFSVSSGTYDIHITRAANQTMEVSLTRCASGGGAHEIFWKQFYSLLASIGQDVVSQNEPEAALAVAKIEEIRTVLAAGGSGGGNWLSTVRNEINYQHRHGVWFPFGAGKRVVESLARSTYTNSSIVRLDHDAYKEPLLAFASGSLVLAALNCEIGRYLVERSDKRARFANQWQQLLTSSAYDPQI